jgi:hypothetical protein
VAVEKLAHLDFAKTASRQEALKRFFRVSWTFCTTRFLTFLRKSEFFNSQGDYHHYLLISRKCAKRISQHLSGLDLLRWPGLDKFIRLGHGTGSTTRSIAAVLPIATARDFGPATLNEFIKMELFPLHQSRIPVLEE